MLLPLPSRPLGLHPALRLAIGSLAGVRRRGQRAHPAAARYAHHLSCPGRSSRALLERSAALRPLSSARLLPLPAGFAIAFTPLSWLGLTAGGIVWGWLNLGVYGWGLWRSARAMCCPAPGRRRARRCS